MSDADGGRRAWRARTGTKPHRLDPVWDFVGWFALFPGVVMFVAALGGRRGPRMAVDETWIWMLAGALGMCVLVLALVIRRTSGVVPRQYPRTMFGVIIFISITANALAWVRLEGEISTTGWAAIGVSAATAALATMMLVTPRRPAQ